MSMLEVKNRGMETVLLLRSSFLPSPLSANACLTLLHILALRKCMYTSPWEEPQSSHSNDYMNTFYMSFLPTE